MSGMMDSLRKNDKKGLFSNSEVQVSYMTGIPVLDHLLGNKFEIKATDEIEKRIGLPAGGYTMIVGPSSSGKTTIAVQIAYNIARRFGGLATIHHCDKEHSYSLKRVKDVTGASDMELSEIYNLKQEGNDIEDILELMDKIASEKEANQDKYRYDTKQRDIFGNNITYYTPTFIIVDSLIALTSRDENTAELGSITSGGREAIQKGRLYRKGLDVAAKYNINILVINHYGDEINITPGAGKAKKLSYLPTGKTIPGGEKPIYYSTTVIILQSVNSKDKRKSEEENGYDGLPVNALIAKCRTNKGGQKGTLELVQATGFHPALTLLNYANENKLLKGINPNRYFESMPDVKFDSRKFLDETDANSEILRALFRTCREHLDDLLPLMQYDDKNEKTIMNDLLMEEMM